MERKLLTIMQACELVCVSRRTIYNWLNDGRLETVRTAGGSIRIYKDSLFQPADRFRRGTSNLPKTAEPTSAV